MDKCMQWEMTRLASAGNHQKGDPPLLLSLKRGLASQFKFKFQKKSLRL